MFSGNIEELPEAIYDVAVSAFDAADNEGVDVSTNELTVDITPPAVLVNLLTTNVTSPALSGTIDETDATIVVTADPAVILDRKREVAPSELLRQLDRYRRLATRQGALLVDGADSPALNAGRIEGGVS